MSIRPFYPTTSDRGSLKNIINGEENFPPTSDELRIKELYEYAAATQDEALLNSLGLIPINGKVIEKTGLFLETNPLSIFQHRQYVNSISQKFANQIEQTKNELAICFANYPVLEEKIAQIHHNQQTRARLTILAPEMMKVAGKNISSNIDRSFRRIS